MDFNSELEIIKEKIESNLKKGNLYLNSSVDYLLSTPGKLLRPTLLLIGSKAGKKGDINNIRDIAAAVETLHIASLVHDDVVDESKLRRGIESIQSKYSKEYAVYMGDYLLSSCFLLLSELDIPRDLSMALAKAVNKMCIGEIRQYSNRYNPEITPLEYLRIVSGKTAALFAISLSGGAYIAGADERVIKRLTHIGYKIGLAFQVVDDLLDYRGSSNQVGKELRKDIIRGYYSMPLIISLMMDSKESREIRDYLDRGVNENTIEEIISLVNRSGAVDHTLNLLARYNEKAENMIKTLPSRELRDQLMNLLPGLFNRVY